MKKILTLAIAGIALASCTADYECNCTVTDTWGGSTTISTDETTLIGVSQAQAEQDYDCVSYTQTSTASDGTVSVYERDCTITKK